MDEYDLEYGAQEVRLLDHVFTVNTVANEALPLEMLLQLQTRSEEISGQRLWEGSLLLCAYLAESCCDDDGSGIGKPGCSSARRPKLGMVDKSVLELGAGTGVVSMLAHRLGAYPVVMTDGDEKCVAMAQKNVEENNIAADEAFVTLLRWGDEESTNTFCDKYSSWQMQRTAGKGVGNATRVALERETGAGRGAVAAKAEGTTLASGSESCGDIIVEGPSSAEVAPHPPPPHRKSAPLLPSWPLKSFDFILAGDVLYKHCLLEPFLRTARDMLAPGGRVLLCHVPRAGNTYDIVERHFTEAGFTFEVLNGNETGEMDAKDKIAGGDGASNTASVGGVELCVDDARRARLYELHLLPHVRIPL